MLKKEYYCLVAGLPDLFYPQSKLGFNGLQLRDEINCQLSSRDSKLLSYLFLPFDNKNLLNLQFQKNEKFNPYGTISEKEFNLQLSPENEIQTLPDYMLEFLKWVNKNELKEYSLEAENKLHEHFYNYVLSTKNQFLKNWFTFELSIKNILSAFNCTKFNYSPSTHLIKAGDSAMLSYLLESKSLKPEHFEENLPFAEQIFKVIESEWTWIAKEKAIDEIKWNYLDENTFFHYFTIEKVLSYVLKILMAERWWKLDKSTGEKLLNRLLNDIKTSYQFDEEFSLNK